MQTVEREPVMAPQSDRVALKDAGLVYRACSMAFAQSLGYSSPKEIIGCSDLDLLPDPIAHQQMQLDMQALQSARADIGTIRLSKNGDLSTSVAAMIVRTPVLSDGNVVRGIDIRLVGGPNFSEQQPSTAINYETWVTEGLQGSLIIDDNRVLFANDLAAKTLGFDTPDDLQSSARLEDLFTREQRIHLKRAALSEVSEWVTAVNPCGVGELGYKTGHFIIFYRYRAGPCSQSNTR